MNIKQIATAVSLSMLLGGSLPAMARSSHKTAEEAATSTTTSAEAPKEHKKREYKKSAREKKEKAEATSAESQKKVSTNEKKGGFSLFRLFAPHDNTNNNAEESKTEPSKKTVERKEASASGNHAGMVFVHGYTTKNGKHVEGYWRHKPGQG